MTIARRAWLGLEAVHAVVYFAPEGRDAFSALGLKGFWMGYFASRAAPLGAVPPEVVEATFFGFAPAMVKRSIPDAWSYASPDAVLRARRDAAGAALRRLLGDVDVTEAAALARDALDGADVGGRPLYAAHRALPWPGEPLGDLWHAATLLREHRGDGHVAAMVAAGFDGLEAHVTQAALGEVPRDALQPNRGWTDDEWAAAEARLRGRGLLDADGGLTTDGRLERDAVESLTDAAASGPFVRLGTERAERLITLLGPLRAAILGGGGIPVPNPMGLPGPSGPLSGKPSDRATLT